MSEDTGVQSNTEVESKPGTTESENTTENFKPQLTAEEYAEKWRQSSAEAKKYRQNFSSLKSEVERMKQLLEEKESQELKTKGEWEAVAKKEKMAREQAEAQYKQATAKWTFREVSSQLEREAIKKGCVDPRALIKLASTDGLIEDLMVDDDLTVAPESLKAAMEKAEKQYNYLFSKTAPKFRDGTPSTNTTEIKKPDYTKFKSADEIIAWSRSNKNLS